jgi:hypothetical protein
MREGLILCFCILLVFGGYLIGCDNETTDSETTNNEMIGLEGTWFIEGYYQDEEDEIYYDKKFIFNDNNWICLIDMTLNGEQIISHWKGNFNSTESEIELNTTHIWNNEQWESVSQTPLLHRYTFINNNKLLIEYEYPEGNWNTTSTLFAGIWDRKIN